jgi:hypothetical protein
MKKILTTTALASALVLSASYGYAQTTITGQLDLGYKAYEAKKAAGAKTSESYRGFTRETQINVQNKGKLSNGIDYTAGFAWEIDGSESVSNAGTAADNTGTTHGAFSENTYINFISGNTTLHIGADHIQNPNFEITNLAGGVADIDDLVAERRVAGASVASANSSLAAVHKTNDASSGSQRHGLGLIQNLGVARASIFYAPGGDAMANDGSANSLGTDAGQSQIELMIRGDMGVKGLDAFVYRGMQDTDTPGTAGLTEDVTGMKYGLSYNFGQFSVAASQSKVSSTADVEGKTTSLGAAFAVNKELTIGLIHSKTSADGTTTSAKSATAVPDEKLKAINIGYNLGPVVANAVLVDSENVGGVRGTDPRVFFVNLTTKF